MRPQPPHSSIRSFSVFALIASILSGLSATAAQPNVILFIGDDISAADIGCYGHPNIHTPNIDKLASNGVLFSNAYLATSQCSPSRGSTITGRYPHNTGSPELHQRLPADQLMFPLELKKAGYYTAAAGKWHLGKYAKVAFDRIELSKPSGQEFWIPCLQERPKDKPFFMWFASVDAHRGWSAGREKIRHTEEDVIVPPYMLDTPGTREDLMGYYDEIQRLDRNVGLVVEELKAQGVYENTLIIFISDNGRPFPRCKTWLYDGGLKPPFVVQWPQGIEQTGVVRDSLVSSIDIAPTIFEAVGLPIPEAFQGSSFMPLVEDPEAVIREYIFAEHNWHDMEAHERMVRWGPWVYIRNARPQLSGWVHAHHKTPSYVDLLAGEKAGTLTAAQADVLRAPRPVEMLFNVETDPDQLVNLAENPEYSERLSFMRTSLDTWQEQTGDTVPEKLTPDRIDRKTFERSGKGVSPPYRGTTPGSERNADKINHPGPR